MNARDGSEDVVAALTEVARAITSPRGLDEALDVIVATAQKALPVFDHVGISRAHRDGSIETMSASDELVLELDTLQYRLGEGPCVDSVLTEPVVAVEHAERDDRWPNYLPEAARRGLRSQLALRLHTTEHTLGGLNLYSTASDTIGPDAHRIAALFAAQAALVLDRTREVAQLSSALSSRKVIGQAIGLTMARYQVDEDRAFEFLARASQTSNIKLRQIAEEVVTGANEQFRFHRN